MIPLSEIEWGPIDANGRDEFFTEKWIEPENIKYCLSDACWIVSGEKGVGKSAITRAIREIHSDHYFVFPLVDFNKVTFRALYENLVELAETTKLSKTITLSNYWQYSIVVELIRSCSEKAPSRYRDLLDRIPRSRRDSGPANKRLVRLLIRLLEEAWNKIDSFTDSTVSSLASRSGTKRANLIASGGLSADLLHDLSTFPLGAEYEAVKLEFFQRLQASKDKVILILDGFDTLKTDGAKAASIQLIFSSLISAVLAIRADQDLPSCLSIKALIPHDRYLGLPLRDSDKVGEMHAAIRWDPDSLREFVRRRIETTGKLRGGNFNSLWRQVFPDKITNPYYSIEEDGFDYILRHTMLRPRQIQMHLNKLARLYPGRNIDPSMVPSAVSKSSHEIAKYFIDEYSIDFPKLESFISSFFRKDNVMSYRTFRELVAAGIKKYFDADSAPTVEDCVDTLYCIGFFGVLHFVQDNDIPNQPYYPPTKESKKHFVDFFFRNPFTKMSTRLSDESLVALHPIFVDFASLRPHSSLIVG